VKGIVVLELMHLEAAAEGAPFVIISLTGVLEE
jgi:hypothetical protein